MKPCFRFNGDLLNLRLPTIQRLMLVMALSCALALTITGQTAAAARSLAEKSNIQHIDETQEKISKAVLDSAEWLDSFFDDERSSAEVNRTRLKLRLSTFKQSTEDSGFSADFDLRLALPKMENRLLLVISGNPDTDEDLDDSPLDEAKRRFQEQDKSNINLALRFFPEIDALSNVSLDAGLAFRRIVPAPYFGGRYRYLWDMKPWQVRFTQSARWYTDRGVEAKTRLDAERKLGKFFFRTSTEWGWFQDNGDGWLPDLRFFLYQPLDETRVIEYECNNYFKTRPEYKYDAVVLRARLRQQFWREWLFFEIAPQVAFRDNNDWEFDPGILLRLEVNFGFSDK